MDCIKKVKKLISFLPSNNLDSPRTARKDDPDRGEDCSNHRSGGPDQGL